MPDTGGIESRQLLAQANDLLLCLNRQARQLVEWREKLASLLLLPLIDEEETDLQGDEYEISTRQQDELYVYMDALRSIVADRHDLLTGQINTRIEHEMKVALDQAKRGDGHAPELLRQLLHQRDQLKPRDNASLRGTITEARELKGKLSGQPGNNRAVVELSIVDTLLQRAHKLSNEQTKIVSELDREVELFRDSMNARLEFYRQLQGISDTVAPFEQDMDQEALVRTLANMKNTENQLSTRIATIQGRRRYLIHLRDEASNVDEQRLCIICQQSFETGILTSCGHSYCIECLRLWWGAHRNCPTCKKHLTRNDFHQIT